MNAGLCDTCAHQKLIHNTRGSTFSMCLRHRTEPERFAKYPPLPVRECSGYGASVDDLGRRQHEVAEVAVERLDRRQEQVAQRQ